ncbi:MAG: ATP-binding protein [Campylobacterales bacterium]|nr:ATP-binding protein [Campylobacterales bacterium]
MQILEYFYNQPLAHEAFTIRKVQLEPYSKINLFGVRGCGKSAIVFDFLDTYYEEEEEYLYIDFDDPHLLFESIDAKKLEAFINENEISALVLDHFETHQLEYIPDVETTIVVSRTPLHLEGFGVQELFALDYEEFIAFEKKSTQNSLNNFLKLGTLPQIAKAGTIHTDKIKRFLNHSFSPNEVRLLAVLAMHNTNHITTHQIYLFAKEKFKISKDWLYKTLKEWQEEKLIILIENRYQKSSKKIIFFDFILSKYLTLSQPFIVHFDNLVALAILKHYHDFEAIGSREYLLHTTNEAIILAPFDTQENAHKKCRQKLAIYQQYGISNAIIVTVANHYSFTIENIAFEAMPFSQWSITST